VNAETPKGRELKKRVYKLLKSENMDEALAHICRFSGRRVVNSLFAFLYHGIPEIRWNAVAAMGAVVARIAHEDMESARVVMRRLMWNLNDESGGIGWGSPEAMGEILACHRGLAEEYASILISYAREDANFQENEMMQRGVLWGIGRLAQVRPELAGQAAAHLIPFLSSPDAGVRGLAAWVAGLLRWAEARPDLENLREDEAELVFMFDRRLARFRVGGLAKEALARLPL
jgi:HEAT-like repeat protein